MITSTEITMAQAVRLTRLSRRTIEVRLEAGVVSRARRLNGDHGAWVMPADAVNALMAPSKRPALSGSPLEGLAVFCVPCGRKPTSTVRSEPDGSITGQCSACKRRTACRTRAAIVIPTAAVEQLLDDAYAGLSVCKQERLEAAQVIYRQGDDPEHGLRLHELADVLDERGPALTDIPGRTGDGQLLVDRLVKMVRES